MLAVGLGSLIVAVLPRIEDPLPESIDMGFPFMLASAFAAFAGIVHANAPRAEWEAAARRGGLRGFQLGTLIYVVSLGNQVLSTL